jgi:esterase/lipase
MSIYWGAEEPKTRTARKPAKKPAVSSGICFLILPGLAPDPQSLEPMQEYFEEQGYTAVLADFWGDGPVPEFRSLTIDQCLAGIDVAVKKLRKKHSVVFGIGVSLGGALLIEYAKTHDGIDYIASIGTPFRLRRPHLVSLGITYAPFLHPLWKLIWPPQRSRPLPIAAGRMATDFFKGRFPLRLDSIKTPILFLHGKKDPLADYRAVYEFARRFTNAPIEIATFEKGGHEIDYDPAMIKDDVFRFLNASRVPADFGLPHRDELRVDVEK